MLLPSKYSNRIEKKKSKIMLTFDVFKTEEKYGSSISCVVLRRIIIFSSKNRYEL
ncbi:hypothetical protein P278_15360 [Zhouia amylolytica AD3]|uniref:Uncharacterized protein n=1 Tax=Zhouia amylolytica AD3 TaxID=1286632 RepID=W2UPG1_9FLAO|nr:hypothetical protein P278_15360 [Zhouia amylolytica AD3]